MSGTEFLTVKGDVAGSGLNPYRPGVVDMGGTDKENDAKYVPSPNDPDATEWNQMVGLLAALGMVAPAALIDVRFSGGTPSIFAIYALNEDIIAGDFTVTDVGTGITTLLCPATKLMDPRYGAGFCQATGNNRATAYRSTTQTLRIETYNAAGAAADVNFLAVWG